MMDSLSIFSLLLNGVTLALSVSFLIVLLWSNAQKTSTQYFAVFLFFVLVWTTGSIMAQASSLLGLDASFLAIGSTILELGFTGASIGLFAFLIVQLHLPSRNLLPIAFSSLILVFAYRVFLLLNGGINSLAIVDFYAYQRQPILILYFVIFDLSTLYMLFMNRRALTGLMKFSICLFIFGKAIGFLNPELQAFSLSITLSSIAALLLSFIMVRDEIMSPLAQRNSQVEAIRRLNLSIASQLNPSRVLDQLARQSTDLLNADAVAIYLVHDEFVELVSMFNLPIQYHGLVLRVGQGVAGEVIQSRKLVLLNDYGREWQGTVDMPLAKETFGSVMCAPLMYAGEAIGALMMINGKNGRVFDQEDVYLLQLFSVQAAVALRHGQLFTEQANLTVEIEQARSQLETVLVSTESPVVAVDRQFQLIFANPAAYTMLSDMQESQPFVVGGFLPTTALPLNIKAAIRDIRASRTHTYEISWNERVYLCHAAMLGDARIEGWVAVLNDITELKELDRIKSEMVRMTSHDLKNPLQAAMANLELLRDDVYDLGNPDVQMSIESIDKQLQRMHRIIRGILDLERLKSGKIALETCAPSQLVMDAVDEIQDATRDQRVEVVTKIMPNLPMIACDIEQFRRALVNLGENAVKFSPHGGKVTFGVELRQKDLIFSVSDTGVGMSQEVQQHVFDRFYRGNQRGVEHVSGSGLGLSLVKTIVENHQGRIWLESEEGVGTTFFISLDVIFV